MAAIGPDELLTFSEEDELILLEMEETINTALRAELHRGYSGDPENLQLEVAIPSQCYGIYQREIERRYRGKGWALKIQHPASYQDTKSWVFTRAVDHLAAAEDTQRDIWNKLEKERQDSRYPRMKS
jgi:hypothetical protein